MEGDRSYFARRAQEARKAARESTDLRARQAHLAMAARYDELAIEIEKTERYYGVGFGHTVVPFQPLQMLGKR